MFRSARFKLTFWYLLVIMFVSASFSAVIYRVLTVEIDRFDRDQRIRIQRQLLNEDYVVRETPFQSILPTVPNVETIDEALLDEVRRRLIWSLVFINCTVSLAGGGFGYLLAGRTLQPIQKMVDEQNRFITDASHELRTPLTVLRTAIEVSLRDTRPTLKDSRTVLRECLQEVKRMQSLSDNLLLLATHRQSIPNPQQHAVAVAKLTEFAITQVQVLAKNKKITFVNKPHTAVVAGQQKSLQDLCIILLDNAIKYSRPGSVITLSSRRRNGNALISVTDQGIGIQPQEITKIFDRFYRADAARSNSTEGYGLGLSIAQQIVEAHNGAISVSSIFGKGSTFTIALPLAAVSQSNEKQSGKN